ncbi:HYR-like domain-containing protein [Mangrovibacterium lignilyticum]|uniref:HYR-like domain-containing protein n=1 Tax=Mangrovibacterium lignilyticum TaxID=2668052 RepID=UPI0013D2A1FA|nr:T9SS type A sorting domain-containing protein [Mangrovibacterium lignilyticum]
MVTHLCGIFLSKKKYPPQGGFLWGILLSFLFFLFNTTAFAIGADPVAQCFSNITVHLDENGAASITAEDLDNGSYDSDGTIALFVDITDFDCTNIGDNDVRLIVVDNDDNSSVCHTNVTVVEDIPPTPDAETLPDILAQCMVSLADITVPTATDNCSGTIAGISDATFPITDQGTTMITWTYTDDSGNSTTQTQNVVIADTEAPIPDMAALDDITAQCEVTALTPPTATDNCAGTIAGTTDAVLPIATTTMITWTYDDGNGNTATQTQNIIVEDTMAPTPDLATLEDVNAQCEVTALTTPTATDNCAGEITGTTDAALPITITTMITWTYDDGNGNTSTQTQNVVVEDTMAPTPDLATLDDVNEQCEVTAITAPTATDNCAGEITGTTDAVFPIMASTTITWTYDDGNGNTSTQSQNVVVDDTLAPTPDLATLEDVNEQCEVTAITAPTATDNCAGEITGTTDAVFPIMASTTITWTYDDGNGNTATQTQNVVVDDTIEPTPDLATLQDVTEQCEVTAITAPTATDNCSGTITGTTDAVFPIMASTTITWTYDDGNGNTATQTQNVVVDDTMEPTPDLATLEDVNEQCEVTAITAPTATDNCSGTITGTTDAVFPIMASTTITWTYDDGNGNTATQTQNIVIEDTLEPVPDLASLTELSAPCEVTAITAPTATDNCSGTITGTTDAAFPIQASTVVIWTFTDETGNTASQTQNVVIDDMEAPTPDLATLEDVTADCEAATITAPTATDNCSGTVTGTTDAVFPIAASTVITWTFTDANGNTATQTQNVIITPSPIADVTLANGTFTYDGATHSLAVAGLPAGASVSYENNDQVNAGTYEVTATVNPGVSTCPELQLTATLTIDKAPQTITFDEIPVMSLEDDPDFGLTATASSGLPVSYTYTYDADTAPATISETGDVSLLTSGTVEITAHQEGNENYLPADPVTQTLTITSSDATIHEIIINNTTYTNPANEIHYEVVCGDNSDQVEVSFTKEVNATADTPLIFVISTPSNGTFTKTIVVTSQDGTQTETYKIVIEKPYTYLNPDIFVIQKFNNVLLVNNNPDNNGGFRFVSFNWYMNDQLIGTGQYYSAGDNANNTLNPNGTYYVEMTDSNGITYRSCDFTVSLTSAAYNMTVSPNPITAGSTIDVQTTYPAEMLTDVTIMISTLYGNPVLQQMTTTNDTRINLPASLTPGTYVVTSKAAGVILSSKIIVQ